MPFLPIRTRLTQACRRGGRALTGGLALVCLGVGVVGPAAAAQLSLTWADTSTNEDGFKVERKTGSTGAYGPLVALAAGTTGYVDAAVATGTTYCYRVRAYNTAGDSAYSNEACATPASATLYTVTVSRAGTGSGTITSSPSGITCGSDCTENYSSGTSIALSATPASGATFTGWSGACTGTGGCALVVEANKSLTATFATSTPATYTLTLTKSGTGSGTVTSSPSGITCGSDCTESYTSGTSVTLSAAPATGSTFAGWSGACTGSGTTCAVSMTAARSVTATFATTPTTTATTPTYALTVTKTGNGSGLIASSPAGLYCGATCSGRFPSGQSVTLAAVTTTRSTFAGWSGACTGSGTTCTVTMGQAQTVTATFTRNRWRQASP